MVGRLRQRHRGSIHQPSCFRLLPTFPFISQHRTHHPLQYAFNKQIQLHAPMSKRPRAEEHANDGGGRQEQHHHRGGGGGYGHGGGRGRGGGRGGGGGKMPHLSAAAEEKRQGMRVQEMETLRKRVVEEAPAPGTYNTSTTRT